MKVVVFGGSGFLGRDFLGVASRARAINAVVYSSRPTSPTGLAPFASEVRRYRADDPRDTPLDADTDVIINFAHPFEQKNGVTGEHQIRRFVEFVDAAKQRIPGLRLVHLSSMSVFEPFADPRRYAETDSLHPPKHDRDASEKVLGETALQRLPNADRWQLHLRPTVVYGPFCRPYTDRFFELFRRGDARYRDLSGRVQPIYGEDISRFIVERLHDFKPGVYNLAGPEEMSWFTFVDRFRQIVGIGRLIQADDGDSPSRPATGLAARLARRIAARVPGRILRRFRSQPEPEDLFLNSFFAQPRLVSDAKFCRDFPSFRRSTVDAAMPTVGAYYRDRFSNGTRAQVAVDVTR